ncbi:MAG: DUF6531 domain-containing protein, partial [Gammaproteobacteria bacterium]
MDDSGCQEGKSQFVIDNPVVVPTGAKYHREVDFSSATDYGLEFVRTYNSAWGGYGILGSSGNKWASNLDLKLSFYGTDGKVCYPSVNHDCDSYKPSFAQMAEILVHRDNGDNIVFVFDGAAMAFKSEEEPLSSLVELSDGRYRLQWPEGGYEIYRSDGVILERRQPDGVGLIYEYDAKNRPTRMVHTSGRYISFGYDGSNYHYLTHITAPDGSVYKWGPENVFDPVRNYSYSIGYRIEYPDGKGNKTYLY